MNPITKEQAIQNFEQLITACLGAGMFKDFANLDIIRASLEKLKEPGEEKK